MAYTSQTTPSSYNQSPPADDGTQTEANKVKWSTIKTKLADPLNTFIENVNAAVSSAFTAIDKLTTQGDVLYRDGSGYQRLGIGTAGQVLTTNSGADAPEWAAPTVDFEFVSTAAITAASSVVVTGLEAGYDYTIQLEAFCPNTDQELLWMRFSDDGGSTYEADAADYGWQTRNGSLDHNSTADTKFALTGTGGGGTSLGNDSGNVNSIKVEVFNPNASSEKTTCFWNGVLMGDAATPAALVVAGGGVFLQGNDAVDAVQFLWSGGGNFKAQGDITVYRRKRS